MPLSDYLERLKASELNLLIFSEGEVIFSSGGKGVTPLIEAIDTLGRERLRGTVTADRIVGRAAVLLNIYLGASEVHAMLITTGARRELEERGVSYKFLEETEAIKMRDGVIYCPFESMVQGIEDPGEAYRRIKEKLAGFEA